MTNLENLRTKQNLSQKAVADAAGIAVSTYCQYENGRRNVPIHVADAISRKLGLSRDTIFLPVKFTVSKTNL